MKPFYERKPIESIALVFVISMAFYILLVILFASCNNVRKSQTTDISKTSDHFSYSLDSAASAQADSIVAHREQHITISTGDSTFDSEINLAFQNNLHLQEPEYRERVFKSLPDSVGSLDAYIHLVNRLRDSLNSKPIKITRDKDGITVDAGGRVISSMNVKNKERYYRLDSLYSSLVDTLAHSKIEITNIRRLTTKSDTSTIVKKAALKKSSRVPVSIFIVIGVIVLILIFTVKLWFPPLFDARRKVKQQSPDIDLRQE